VIAALHQAVTDYDVHDDTPLHVTMMNPDVSYEVVHALLKACPTPVASVANNEGQLSSILLKGLTMADICSQNKNMLCIVSRFSHSPLLDSVFLRNRKYKKKLIPLTLPCRSHALLRTVDFENSLHMPIISPSSPPRQSLHCL
jgi:hypothetical protein